MLVIAALAYVAHIAANDHVWFGIAWVFAVQAFAYRTISSTSFSMAMGAVFAIHAFFNGLVYLLPVAIGR
ncbi:MAG: hypothetical protein JNN20_03995 [Betaproteobacteria bacterium]|nr:hypothetical protein [Betaproteobacteria bacterium]